MKHCCIVILHQNKMTPDYRKQDHENSEMLHFHRSHCPRSSLIPPPAMHQYLHPQKLPDDLGPSFIFQLHEELVRYRSFYTISNFSYLSEVAHIIKRHGNKHANSTSEEGAQYKRDIIHFLKNLKNDPTLFQGLF